MYARWSAVFEVEDSKEILISVEGVRESNVVASVMKHASDYTLTTRVRDQKKFER